MFFACTPVAPPGKSIYFHAQLKEWRFAAAAAHFLRMSHVIAANTIDAMYRKNALWRATETMAGVCGGKANRMAWTPDDCLIMPLPGVSSI